MKLHITPILLLLALALGGCSQEESFVPPLQEQAGEIVFVTECPSFTDKWNSSIAESSPVTRGESFTSTTLRKVGVFGYSHTGFFDKVTESAPEALRPDYFLNTAVVDQPNDEPDKGWNYNGVRKYWPTDGRNVSFFAYAPYDDLEEIFALTPTSNTASGAPTIDYTVPAGIADQVDLMWGNRLDMTAQTEGGVVPLTMHHALTKVDFVVKLDNGGNISTTRVRFDKLEISNVASRGVLDMSKMPSDPTPWTGISGVTTYTLTRGWLGGLNESIFDAAKTNPELPGINPYSWNSLLPSGQSLMLIPQELTSSVEAVLNYTLIDPVDGTETKKTITLSLSPLTPSATWTPGQSVTYQITIPVPAADPASGHALKMTNGIDQTNAWGAQVWYQLFDDLESLEEGETYTYSFWVKGDSQTDNAIQLFLQDSHYDGGADQEYFPAVPVTTEWTMQSWTITPKHTTLDRLIFNIGNYVGTIWVDNISLTAEGSSENLIVNGDFETPQVSQGPQDQGMGHWAYGNHALKMHNEGATSSSMPYDNQVWYKLPPDSVLRTETEYTLRFMVKRIGQNTLGYNAMQIYLQDSSWVNEDSQDSVTGTVPVSDQWNEVSWVFTPTADTRTRILFNIGDLNGDIWVDNVQLSADDYPQNNLIVNGGFEVQNENVSFCVPGQDGQQQHSRAGWHQQKDGTLDITTNGNVEAYFRASIEEIN